MIVVIERMNYVKYCIDKCDLSFQFKMFAAGIISLAREHRLVVSRLLHNVLMESAVHVAYCSNNG
jgi:hypothetical protein